MKSFMASMIASMLLLIFGHNSPYLIILFMFSDSILVHSISPLYQVLLADYIDEDMTYYSRPKPISTIIYGLVAVLVRPAQSFAPFIVVVILTQFGYKVTVKSFCFILFLILDIFIDNHKFNANASEIRFYSVLY
ncbi:unnamed protein product [Onchocerca flexuosa]|uniref:HCO3_cotransp domain-containing protein n=1 Tax=Onchocerca flexuosa TaxID=387005 RepID=A0A183HRW9_9BILA|nr:unnamed protein product [Onchocerca flexuosa]